MNWRNLRFWKTREERRLRREFSINLPKHTCSGIGDGLICCQDKADRVAERFAQQWNPGGNLVLEERTLISVGSYWDGDTGRTVNYRGYSDGTIEREEDVRVSEGDPTWLPRSCVVVSGAQMGPPPDSSASLSVSIKPKPSPPSEGATYEEFFRGTLGA